MIKGVIAVVIFLLIAIIVVLGYVVFVMLHESKHKKPDGYIRVNKSDPNKDTYTLELDIPFGELDDRKEVIFAVVGE